MAKAGNILLFSRDPGGTNQLVALRDILLNKKPPYQQIAEVLDISEQINIQILAKDYAKDIWNNNSISSCAYHSIENHLDDLKPDLILTATSHMDDHSQEDMWEHARQRGIKTACFLDISGNIALRFQNANGQYVFPDDIFLLSQDDCQVFIDLGLPQSRLHVIGDLYADYIKNCSADADGLNLRALWKINPTDSVILFASDYITEMMAEGMAFQVTEFEGLDLLLELLQKDKIPDITGPYRLIIRPHPKDKPGKYDHYLDRNFQNLSLIISDQGTSLDAVKVADVTASVGSSLLNEAEVLGRATLNLTPLCLDHKGS